MGLIAATDGRTASNATATTTLAFSAIALTGGQDIVVAVALADTTKTITGIADTAGNTYVRRSFVNGTGVRSEIWEAQSIIPHGSDVITITFSGATLAAAAMEEYAGIQAQSALVYPTDYAPHTMTTNTNPPPYVITASSNFGGRDPFKAFNGDYTGGEGSEWLGTTNGVDYLSIDLGAAYTVTAYRITTTNSAFPARCPKTWTLRGSNDNFGSFTTLDTQASQTAWSQNEARTFTMASSGSFRYYRVNITANNGDGNYTGILELNLFAGTPTSLTPQNTITATGSGIQPQAWLLTQEFANWTAAAVAFVCNSGDTVAAIDTTIRQSVIPALTSVGIVLLDRGSGAPASSSMNVRLSTARNWAVAGVELRSGGAVGGWFIYAGRLPVTGNPLNKETRVFGKMPSLESQGCRAGRPLPTNV